MLKHPNIKHHDESNDDDDVIIDEENNDNGANDIGGSSVVLISLLTQPQAVFSMHAQLKGCCVRITHSTLGLCHMPLVMNNIVQGESSAINYDRINLHLLLFLF